MKSRAVRRHNDDTMTLTTRAGQEGRRVWEGEREGGRQGEKEGGIVGRWETGKMGGEAGQDGRYSAPKVEKCVWREERSEGYEGVKDAGNILHGRFNKLDGETGGRGESVMLEGGLLGV